MHRINGIGINESATDATARDQQTRGKTDEAYGQKASQTTRTKKGGNQLLGRSLNVRKLRVINATNPTCSF